MCGPPGIRTILLALGYSLAVAELLLGGIHMIHLALVCLALGARIGIDIVAVAAVAVAAVAEVAAAEAVATEAVAAEADRSIGEV